MMTPQSGLPTVHLFDGSGLDPERLGTALVRAGFGRSTGFELLAPLRPGKDRDVEVRNGSLVVVPESSFSRAQRFLQASVPNLASLYLIVITQEAAGDSSAERAKRIRRGLPHLYRHVAVLPGSADEKSVATEAAGLVERHRMDPEGVLLWILDDAPDRFQEGGCWARLISAAEASSARDRLRVVPTLVDAEALAGSRNREALVSIWRNTIIEPAFQRGIRVVMVTDNQFSPTDLHLGEMWAATVLQRLPRATAFVASIHGIELDREAGGRSSQTVGIWINADGHLSDPDTELVLSALTSDVAEPRKSLEGDAAIPTLLSRAPIRAVALSTTAFQSVWPELLRYRGEAIRKSLHYELVRAGSLDEEQRQAIWEALGWNNDLAARLRANREVALAVWVQDLPAEHRPEAISAWAAVLERPMPEGDQHPGETRVVSRERVTFLAVCDEWASRRGGLSTFNRELCLALARAGHGVQCLVTFATDSEAERAAEQGVRLVRREARSGEPATYGLFKQGNDTSPPDFVLGHGRITGAAARAQAEHFGAQRVHFLHMAPEEIEPVKSQEPDRTEDWAKLAESRMREEIELARDSSLAVGVGPRLFRELDSSLVRRPRPLLHRLDPGFVTPSDSSDRPLFSNIYCLVLGRVNDYYLKGLDLAAGALGALASSARRRYKSEITLVVRGAEPETASVIRQRLRSDAREDLTNIRIRNISSDPEILLDDLLQASVVLVPSKAEGFGLVGLEAIAAGTPVLISDRSGLADLLDEHDLARDVVVPVKDSPQDVTRWKEAVDHILLDRPAAFARAEQLRSRLAAVCTWEDAVSKFVDALTGVRRSR